MAKVELTEKEYLEFKEYQKSLKESRIKEIPNEITKLDEQVKIEKEKLKDEKKNLSVEIKVISKEIKDLKKSLKNEDTTNESSQENIQNDYKN